MCILLLPHNIWWKYENRDMHCSTLLGRFSELCIFSSSEPKAQDDLLWYLAVRRLSVCLSSVHVFERLLLWNPWANFLQTSRGADWKFVQMVTVRWLRWPPCPYMVKTLKNLLQNQDRLKAESWCIASGLKVYQVCLNGDRRLTSDLFMIRTNLDPHAFVWEKYRKVIFSKCIKD